MGAFMMYFKYDVHYCILGVENLHTIDANFTYYCMLEKLKPYTY